MAPSNPSFPRIFRTPAPGTDIGGFEVGRTLGSGGMGSVLEARERGPDRRVAVKFLRDGFLRKEGALRRFRSEARALAKISHPHVVKVHALGDWEGWPYIVMEYVEGPTLARRLDEGALPLEEALRVGEELASALAALHARRIVHRDVNPSNGILRAADGSLCLVDFGLARELDRASASTGTIAGTPFYMAPERLAGRASDVRADVYSFGATLFEMLAGEPPFAEVSEAAFFHTVKSEDAPLLRTRCPGAPREVEVLVARALSRAPEFRQRDGETLLRELRAARGKEAGSGAGEVVAAGVPPPDAEGEVPLLDRDDAYARAVEILDGALDRRGGLLLVEGDPGAGKSRFLAEVERAARARAMSVLRCRGEEAARAPFGGLRAMVLEAASTRRASGPRAFVDRVFLADPSNEPLLPALRWFLDPASGGAPPAPSRSILSKALLAALRTLLVERPGLLVAEDLHLLDEGSLDLLVTVAEEVRAWPLAFAASHLPPGHPGHGPALASRLPRLRAGARTVLLRMEPLGEPAVATMIRRLLRVPEAEAARLAPLLRRKSAGNPLHVVESLRVLEQEGFGRRNASRSGVRRRLTRLEIPPRLLELAARRLDGLPAEERDALGVVATDPAGLPAALIARCLEISRLAVLRVLQRLDRERGLVRESEGRYLVAHGEIRHAVYAGLLPELRSASHAAIAAALLEAGEEGRDPARVGFHLRHAGRAAQALPLLVEGGRRLLADGAGYAALECFESALECGPDVEAARGRTAALETLGESEEPPTSS